MADVSNIRGLFNDEVLAEKLALLNRLEAVGFAQPSYHYDGRHVWVCPDYVEEEGAVRLADALEKGGLKQGQLPLDDIRVFTGFKYA